MAKKSRKRSTKEGFDDILEDQYADLDKLHPLKFKDFKESVIGELKQIADLSVNIMKRQLESENNLVQGLGEIIKDIQKDVQENFDAMANDLMQFKWVFFYISLLIMEDQVTWSTPLERRRGLAKLLDIDFDGMVNEFVKNPQMFGKEVIE